MKQVPKFLQVFYFKKGLPIILILLLVFEFNAVAQITLPCYAIQKSTLLNNIITAKKRRSKLVISPYFSGSDLTSVNSLRAYILKKRWLHTGNISFEKNSFEISKSSGGNAITTSITVNPFVISNCEINIETLANYLNKHITVDQLIYFEPYLYLDATDHLYHLNFYMDTLGADKKSLVKFLSTTTINPSPPNQPVDYKKPN